MPIINPFNPSTPNGELPEDATNILTPQNIKSPQEMLNYMLSDMRQLVMGFETTRANQILFVGKLNQLGAMVVKLTEENARIRKGLAKLGVEIEEVPMPELPEQTKKVLEDYAKQKEENEAHAFAPHPNYE